AEVPFNVPGTVGANRSVLDQAVGSSQAPQPSQPPLQIAKRQDIAVSQLPYATAATPLSDGGSPSAVVVPKIATTVVPVGTASGASAVSPTARACDTQSFTKRTRTKFEIQIVFIPARSLSFLRMRAEKQ